MSTKYYSLPLALNKLFYKEPLAKCSLPQSVHQNLHLILTTAFGELANDENFGCSIWNHDFDNVTCDNKMKEKLRQSLLSSIHEYEKRINNVRIDLLMGQEEIPANLRGYHVKRVIQITISGVLNATNEP